MPRPSTRVVAAAARRSRPPRAPMSRRWQAIIRRSILRLCWRAEPAGRKAGNSMKFGIGQPVPRTEDPRFLTGRGRYVADITRPGEAHGFVLRSPHAHAVVRSIDVGAARAAPGV